MLYRILLLYIITDRNDSAFRWRWFKIPSLARFFKFWLRWKLGVDAKIDTAVFPAYGVKMTEKIFREYMKGRNYSFFWFITDNPYPARHVASGWLRPDLGYQVTRHIRGPDYAELINTSLCGSHEFLHYFLKLGGRPKEIWNNRVDMNDKQRVRDYWTGFSIIGWFRQRPYRRIDPAIHRPKYVTVGGEYKY